MQIKFSEIDYEEFIKLVGQKASEFKHKEIVYENTKSDVQFTWKTITTFISSTIDKNVLKFSLSVLDKLTIQCRMSKRKQLAKRKLMDY